MPFQFDTIFDRRSTESVKWNHFPSDVLPLWVADMDFATPPAVTEALRQRVDHPIYGYPFVKHGLITAIQSHLQRLYGWHVEPEELLFLPGVVISFNLATQALAHPGGSVVFMTPVYMPFFELAKNAGLQQVTIDLLTDETGRYTIDWERLEAAMAAHPDLFILC
ncbi:aminotransferase class I/II-fold pyridoxal phosphate-dependent enzyme, partial [bacterium]|nr:aminotransferase class I/II-fold pyridoxal phosphate-dependent enzyme [bacterium]